MSEKETKDTSDDIFESFASNFEKAGKKAGTEHRNGIAKAPKYDLNVIKSGQGGFTEPEDDGIRP